LKSASRSTEQGGVERVRAALPYQTRIVALSGGWGV
jgi:hypothetical protein